ncbi:MAG: NUDIX hydrolase [Smithellaceae bacterium]|nr:NUDIX hydrolase [Smithellaceae bacterium]
MGKHKKKSYTCKIFTVWEEDVELATGKKTRQSWIDHKPTVAVVAVNAQNELLLIRQFRVPIGQNLLEIPAGSFDHDGESPADCAQRELAEETGYRAGTLTRLFAGYLLPGYCNEFMYFFLAQDLVYAPLTPDEDECIEVIPVSFANAAELLKSGEMNDAKTVLGIMLAGKHLNNALDFS